MEELGEVSFHRDWKHYLKCKNTATCRMVALSASQESTTRSIILEFHPGASVPQAEALLANVKIEALKTYEKDKWEISTNFHFADSRRQFFFATSSLDVWQYLKHWEDYKEQKRQFKRSEDDFIGLLDYYHQTDLISDRDRKELNELLLNSGRNVLRVIPGLSLYYSWKLEDAVAIDATKEAFATVVKEKIEEIFSCWGQSMNTIVQPEEDEE